MQDKIFLDTNILVYLVNEDSPFHANVSKKFSEIRHGHQFWISRQILREYAVVMTRPGIMEKPLSSEELVSDIEAWKRIFQIADETEQVTDRLTDLIKNFNIKGKRIHDANIVATMLTNSISKLFTVNLNDFKKFKEIDIVTID